MSNHITPSGQLSVRKSGFPPTATQSVTLSQLTSHDLHSQPDDSIEFASLMSPLSEAAANKSAYFEFQNQNIETINGEKAVDTSRSSSSSETEDVTDDQKIDPPKIEESQQETRAVDIPKGITTSEQLFSLNAPQRRSPQEPIARGTSLAQAAPVKRIEPESTLDQTNLSRSVVNSKRVEIIGSSIESTLIVGPAIEHKVAPRTNSSIGGVGNLTVSQIETKSIIKTPTRPDDTTLGKTASKSATSEALVAQVAQDILSNQSTALLQSTGHLRNLEAKQIGMPISTENLAPSSKVGDVNQSTVLSTTSLNHTEFMKARILPTNTVQSSIPVNQNLMERVQTAVVRENNIAGQALQTGLPSVTNGHAAHPPIPASTDNSAARPDGPSFLNSSTQTSNQNTLPTRKILPEMLTGNANAHSNPGIENGKSSLLQGELQEVISWETPRLSQVGSNSTLPSRNDFAPHVLRQLVEVMGQAMHRPTEITLSPEELGRVRMSVHKEDGVITVNIIAERADTLELMRRNIDQLGQTFRAMGYETISFAFGQGNDTGNQKHSSSDTRSDQLEDSDHPAAEPTSQANPNHIQLDHAQTAGIDIRL